MTTEIKIVAKTNNLENIPTLSLVNCVLADRYLEIMFDLKADSVSTLKYKKIENMVSF